MKNAKDHVDKNQLLVQKSLLLVAFTLIKCTTEDQKMDGNCSHYIEQTSTSVPYRKLETGIFHRFRLHTAIPENKYAGSRR